MKNNQYCMNVQLTQERGLPVHPPGHAADPLPIHQILAGRAAATPQGPAYVFLHATRAAEPISYSLLFERVRRFARVLADALEPGARAVLLYQPGLDYIVGLYACLWAGVTPVPAYPVHNNQHGRRLLAVLADCSAAALLAPPPDWPAIQAALRGQAGPGAPAAAPLLLSEPTAGALLAEARPLALALLQYTSGSTGAPKGVMVSHANLLHNLEQIRTRFGHDAASVMVSWLPPYHDMGLVSGVLEPMYAGFPVYLMSPFDFLQRPLRWLRALSDYRATVSGAPNFAFDLCVERIDAAAAEGLDLSSLSVLYNGAEPVRPATLARFAQRFAHCGLRPQALYPCYGLAEATLMVSGGRRDRAPLLFDRDLQPCAAEQEARLAGVGTAIADHTLLIVDPERLTPVPPGVEGEIWVRGPGVAQGYWGAPGHSAAIFGARTRTGDGPYLRTGDLGRMAGAELVVTGRCKDLIIIRGRNLHPHDLEDAVVAGTPDLAAGTAAAFQFERDGAPRIALVAEISRHARRRPAADVIARMRAAARASHQLELDAVALVLPGRALRTSSGKIQRARTRAAFLDGGLALWAAVCHTAPLPG